MGIYSVICQLINLANVFYTYLTCYHPLIILLAYFLLYLTCIYFIGKVDDTVEIIDRDGIPNHYSRIRYGKEKYIYTFKNAWSKQRKGRKERKTQAWAGGGSIRPRRRDP